VKRQPKKIPDKILVWHTLSETRWADTGQLLTVEEVAHALKTGRLERPVEISERVPQGTEKTVLAAGSSPSEGTAVRDALQRAIGLRLFERRRLTSIPLTQTEEAFDLMLAAGTVAPKKLLPGAKGKKLKKFRKRLHCIKAQSQKPIFKSDEAQRHKFMRQNWTRWTTVKNPRAREEPALHAWHPRAAFNLLKDEGHLHPLTRYNPIWYKRVRRLLRLKPRRPYSVLRWPEE
jgi:hypothetical protein